MRDRVVDLLEKVDLALASSAGVIPDESLTGVAAVRDLVRTRLAYPEDVIVAGLVGGTGSGKSSLLNAVALDNPGPLFEVVGGAVVLALVTTKVPLFASQMLGAHSGFGLRSLFVEGQ